MSSLSHDYLSTLAIRKTIEQVRAGMSATERPGGLWDRGLQVLNAAGGLLFLGGVFVMGVCVYLNVR